MSARVAALRVHPLKSAAALAVTESRVDPLGLEGDRRWLLVDAGGAFLTQRAHPALCLLRALPLPGGALRLEASGRQGLDVPVPRGPERLEVEIWGDRVAAAPAGAAADAWVSAFVGAPTHLVWFPPDAARPIGEPPAAPEDEVRFPDRYPLLVLSVASLEGLHRRLGYDLPLERFRPNLVVSGVPAHAEDTWARIRVGGVEVDVVKGCARCAVTTVDPATGQRGKEPLRTLGTYRAWDGKVWFGQNAIPRGEGVLRVGDTVQVLATREGD